MSAPSPIFGGVPRQTVSDNLKAGITKACFHEPMVNRPYKPRDKAKAEVSVQVVGR
jgi:transposase